MGIRILEVVKEFGATSLVKRAFWKTWGSTPALSATPNFYHSDLENS
jgi:hypothetical protein